MDRRRGRLDPLEDRCGPGGPAAHGGQSPAEKARRIRDGLPNRRASNHAPHFARTAETAIVKGAPLTLFLLGLTNLESKIAWGALTILTALAAIIVKLFT